MARPLPPNAMTCPSCNGYLSAYADRKYNGICPWCVRLDSGDGGYRIRFNRKYTGNGDAGGNRIVGVRPMGTRQTRELVRAAKRKLALVRQLLADAAAESGIIIGAASEPRSEG